MMAIDGYITNPNRHVQAANDATNDINNTTEHIRIKVVNI